MDPVANDPARPKVGHTGGATADSGQPAPAAPASGGDAVTLSSDLQLAERAMRAATAGTDADSAARIRAVQESGAIHVDLDGLADRMIDALLHSHDDRT